MITIELVNKRNMQGHAAYVISSVEDLPEKLFSQEEKAFILEQKAMKQKWVTINRFSHRDYIGFLSGEEEAKALEEYRTSGDELWLLLKKEKERGLSIIDCVGKEKPILALLEGYLLGSYTFGRYKVKEREEIKLPGDLEVVSNSVSEKELNLLKVVVKATMRARDLVNEPVQTLNATAFAEVFMQMATESGMEVEVFGKKKIEALRMGGLLGVNQGSPDDPTFTRLEWKPEKAVNTQPIVLVGKGVVYDTGGMNIKTGTYMEDMKSDMGGAAAMGCAIYAAALAKLPVHVIALLPATDNRVDGNAIVSGDILTMYSGATVEVINTDAEGRLILADALAYAKQYNPEVVIDAATLTGAAHRAIGKYATVGMQAKATNYFQQLSHSGDEVGERIVAFPLWDDYRDLLKSEIADIRNISTAPEGGAITAGKFLEYFTDYPYIHLDIAGPAFVTSRYSYRGVGGTGVGVRMLFHFLRHWK
ncbi:MAG: peptidase M17 [Bacteroidetes bacterium]|nr:MAG: peptidase M17 [Bacteroidota bacterium]